MPRRRIRAVVTAEVERMGSSKAIHPPTLNTRAGGSCRQQSNAKCRFAAFCLCHFLYIGGGSAPVHDRRGRRAGIVSLARCCLALTVTVLAVLSQFGIQTTSLVAVIGAAELEAQSTV